MKPKLKDLTNAVIDCDTNERLREVVTDHVWANIAVPTKGQGIIGITPYDKFLKIRDGVWETTSMTIPTTTHHINDIEL